MGGEVGWEDGKGGGGRDGCGLVWRVESGGRFADISAWAAAREAGDGARSMSAVCVSVRLVEEGSKLRGGWAHTGERLVRCGDEWHIFDVIVGGPSCKV